MQKKEICWNITTKCNQNCKYCHRFLEINDLTFEENKKILENLIADGVTDITWTGGEALLYPNLISLVKMASESGIRNKLITNGLILAKNPEKREILNYINNLTLSLDSIDNEINETLGRGYNHYNNIKTILDYIKNKNIELNINTVVNSKNVNCLNKLGEFLNNYKVDKWKLFKFMPLRETAEKNKEVFEISEDIFNSTKRNFRNFENIKEFDYRQEDDMEKKYVLIVANGDIIMTENGKDVKKGNALYNNLMEFMD